MKAIEPAQERKTLSMKSLKTVKGRGESLSTHKIIHAPASRGAEKPRSPRQVSREMAVQCLYHHLLNPDSLDQIIAQVMLSRKRRWSPNEYLPIPSAAPAVLSPPLKSPPPVNLGVLLQSAHSQAALSVLPVPNRIAKKPEREDRSFFRILIEGARLHQDSILTTLEHYLDRPIAEISPMVLAILILGGYELLYQPITPLAVILNEAIELAKRYSAEESYRYVNGVLEKLARAHRLQEYSLMSPSNAPKS